jgi:hypothetical protein
MRRTRSTKAEVEQRRDALYRIVEGSRPATVRQVYYLATVAGLVPKTENGYDMVQTDLTLMRRAGLLPYDWLADSTRWQRKPTTFCSVEEALEDTARLYRKALWADADAYVEIWLEKDALAGVVYPVTEKFDVPLMVARGYASLSFLHDAAEYIADLNVSAHIYHLGDYDPSGQDAARAIEKTLREMAPEAEIHFERLAVTGWQIANWRLPTRPTKTTDSRAKGFGAVSVELDAIPPGQLRSLVQKAIERHLPPEQYRVLWVAEASERRLINGLVGMAKSKMPEEKPEPRRPRDRAAPTPSVEWHGPPPETYFDADYPSEAEKADWCVYSKLLRAQGNSDEGNIIEWCCYLIDSRGYKSAPPPTWARISGVTLKPTGRHHDRRRHHRPLRLQLQRPRT